MSCTDCALHENCKSVKVDSLIKPHSSDILLVLDAPDRDDDNSNKILAKDVGKKVLYLLEKAGIDKDRVSYTYAVRCKPKSNSDVKLKHIEACRKYLFKEIIDMKPKVIIPMGKIAHWALTGHQSVTEFRGHFTKFEMEYGSGQEKYGVQIGRKKLSIDMIPTMSPHTSMMKWELHDYLINDLKKALKFADTGVIDKTIVPQHELITTRQGLKDFMDYMLSDQVKWSTNDLETTGFSFFNDKIINSGYCTNENKIFVLHTKEYQPEHFKKWDKENQELGVKINEFVRNNRESIFKVMKRVHASDIKWIYHNGKFDLKFLKQNGVPVKNFFFDTLLADSYIDENKMHSLNFCLEMRGHNFGAYDTELYPYVGKGKSGKKTTKTYESIPPKLIGKYLAIDVFGDSLLYRDQVKELKKEGLLDYFMKVKMQALREMTKVEFNGVTIDVPLIKKTEEQLSLKIKELEAESKAFTKIPEFNMSSPKQIVDFMTEHNYPFHKLGIKQNKTGYSTDKKSLLLFVKYKKWAKLPQMILTYKTLTKLAGTYVAGKIGRKAGTEGGLLQYADSNDKVHANFNLWTPRTGRYSCNKPSLQVWPRPIKGLPNIRNFIKPSHPDYVLWEADYSQLEQCVVAILSEDPVLLGKIQDGTDLHCFNAVELGRKLGTIDKDVTYEYMMTAVGKGEDVGNVIDPASIPDATKALLKELRTQAKAIGFGLNYGKTAMTFATDFGISEEDAEDMVEAYFGLYKKMKLWRDRQVSDALTKGVVTLLSGRKRRFHQAIDWLNSDYAEGLWVTRRLSEEVSRQAMNSPVQGGAHDVFEPAKLRFLARLRKEKIHAPLMLSIHDGMVGECHRNDIEAVRRCLLEELPITFNEGTSKQLRLKVDVDFYESNWYGEKLK
jgi:uracil-DNA glycosylase family 4